MAALIRSDGAGQQLDLTTAVSLAGVAPAMTRFFDPSPIPP